MTQWYLSFGGNQVGPFDSATAAAKARENPNGHAWREGFPQWVPIAQVGELSGSGTPGFMPPPPANRGSGRSDQIDYRIVGSEMQFVEIELDPGESAIAEAGSMMYKDVAIQMESVFGDGRPAQSGGFMDKLIGAGKRVITGESLFITMFSHGGSGKAKVAFAAPYPGNIIPVNLAEIGGSIICQKDSFLCAARGVSIGLFFQKKILTALFGGEGFIMQKLEGDGQAFLHAGGTICERELRAGEELDVDTGCLVAIQPTVNFDVRQAGNIKSMIFGGEGVFFAHLRGPGKIWLQSLPLSRMSGRILAAATTYGGREEGSVLGGLGGLLQGDR
jgi:uncharacterized protein (TIGR00266 family)